jgi:hypothetical protein
MEHRILDVITAWIGGLALPLVLFASVVGGFEAGIGAVAGVGLAVLDWAVIRRIALTVGATGGVRCMRWLVLWVGKTVAVMALVLACAAVFDATGLVLGVSAMVIGIFAGAVHAHARGHGGAEPERGTVGPAAMARARGVE